MTYEQIIAEVNEMNIDVRMELLNELAIIEDCPFEIHRMEDFDEFMSYLTEDELSESIARSKGFDPFDEVYWLDEVEGSDNLHSGSIKNCSYLNPSFVAKLCTDKEIDIESILREWGWR